MKKLIALLLIFALCASFCACGEDDFAWPTGDAEEPTEENNALYEKYAYLLELLEAGDFEAARRLLDEMESVYGSITVKPTDPEDARPLPTEPEPTEEQWRNVEITDFDSFFDYFKPIQVLDVERNGFGELVRVNLYTYFVPRDGLIIDGDRSQLAIEYGYTFCGYPLIEDKTTGEITLGEPIYSDYPYKETATEDFTMGYCCNGEYAFNLYVAATFTDSPEDTELWTVSLNDFTIWRTKGTIRIKGEPTDERFFDWGEG